MVPTYNVSRRPRHRQLRRAFTPVYDLQPAAPPVLEPRNRPVRFHDIYVDDFIMGTQGNRGQRVQHVRRLLYSIDAIFRPLEEGDAGTRTHVPSVKKLLKGDACLATRKQILGWIIVADQPILHYFCMFI